MLIYRLIIMISNEYLSYCISGALYQIHIQQEIYENQINILLES